jgi:UDP-glucose 4-epimerase
MNNKLFLVTGAAGFIGGALAKKLLEDGNKIVTIDNLSTGFIEAIPLGVEFFQGNCQDINIVSQLEKYTFDAIFHIAGQSSGEISFDDPVYDLQTNAQSTLLLLKLALKTNCKKFIYASTMSVYGDKPDKPVKENTILSTKSFYGVGKIASEHYMRIYEQYGITCTALRLFNVYGPGQNMENLRQGMVSIFLAQAIADKHIHIKGSKDRFRDFVYIDDVVEAFIKAYNRQGVFKALNLSTARKSSIEFLINLIQENLPFEITVEYSGSTPGDQFGIVGANSKAKEELGWEPNISLENGIMRMCNWAINISK